MRRSRRAQRAREPQSSAAISASRSSETPGEEARSRSTARLLSRSARTAATLRSLGSWALAVRALACFAMAHLRQVERTWREP